jgi:hypothetical protein
MYLEPVIKYIKHRKWIIPLLGVAIAYLPLISNIMSIKNDSCVLSYPIFYYFSSQISNGTIPFWHFNMHLGFPMYADPGTPFLNPVFWLFAILGSSIKIYVYYILIHLAFGAIGMYLLGRQLNFENKTSLILSIAYIAGGYFVAHLQHSNHIIECTYLPFVVNYLYALFKKPTLKNSILLGLFFYLFTISGYPGFAIGMPYYIAILGFGFLLHKQFLQIIKRNVKPIVLFALSILIAIIFCSPFLYALFVNVENFQRSAVFSGDSYLFEGGASPVLGLMSFVLPLVSVVKNSPFFSSDMAWNNMFIGIIPLLFFIAAIKYKNLSLILPHLLAIAFFLDISFEGQIKQLFFKLPLLNFLRYNGGLRIYAMLSMLIVSGYALNNYFTSKKPDINSILKINKILFFLILFTAIIALVYGLKNNSFSINNHQSWVKNILNIKLVPAILIQSVYVLFILFLLKKFLPNKKKLFLIAIADVIFCFWVNLPFSGLSIKSMPSITDDIEASKKYINKQNNFLLLSDSLQKPAINHVVYAPALLSNHIGIIPPHAYPSGKKTYFDFIEKNGLDYFNNKPVCFLYSNVYKALPYKINAESMSIECLTKQPDTLFIHQNFDKHWTAFSQNSQLNVYAWQNNFIKIALPANTNTVKLVYKDTITKKLLFIPLAGLIFVSIFLIYSYKKIYKINSTCLQEL